MCPTAESGAGVSKPTVICKTMTKVQTTQFILDDSKSFAGLDAIDFSMYARAVIFVDKAIDSTWGRAIEEHLAKRIHIARKYEYHAVESLKSTDCYRDIINRLSDFTASDLIIAIGGGRVLDAISFAASTYMRGVPILLIPTTLIGQADASTAGKTCLNVGDTKNLVGTLHMPDYVYDNVRILDTLSIHDMRQGFSEIFKYGLLGSPALLDMLLKYKYEPSDSKMKEILEETISVRLKLRDTHPLASNLGHTFGHALETLSRFDISHGDAISIGTVMALDFSVREGIIKKELRNKIVDKMIKLGLQITTNLELDVEVMSELMMKDKKATSDSVGLVLISDIGQPLITQNKPFYHISQIELEVFLIEWF